MQSPMLYQDLACGQPRKRMSGPTGYHAQIPIKLMGAIVHRELRTFDRKPAVATWPKDATPNWPSGRPRTGKTPEPTLASVIDGYTEESVKDIGRTKTQVLRAIKNRDIANQPCSTITSTDIMRSPINSSIRKR